MTLAALGLAALCSGLLFAAAHGGLRAVALSLLGCGFIAVTWNAVRVGPLEPADAFLLAACAVLFVDSLRRRNGPWMPLILVAGAALIVLSGIFTALNPPSLAYLGARTVFDNPDLNNPYIIDGLHAASSSGNLTELAKFLVALIVLPVAVQILRPSAAEARGLAAAWAISALISGAIAVSDAAGVTHVSAALLGYVPGDGRQAGLSVQPNHLAMALVLATPVVLSWLRAKAWPVRVVALPAILVLCLGELFTGSRGGLIGVLLAAVLTFALVPGLRPSPRALVVMVPAFCLVLLVAGLTVLSGAGTVSRLGAISGDLSDAQRSLAQAQAIMDIGVSPLHGIGFDHIAEAHQELLQLLAAGGVIGLVGYVVYWIGAIRTGFIARRGDPNLASVLLVAMVCFLVVSLVENQVTDRYLYVPVALAVALAAPVRAQERARRKALKAIAEPESLPISLRNGAGTVRSPAGGPPIPGRRTLAPDRT